MTRDPQRAKTSISQAIAFRHPAAAELAITSATIRRFAAPSSSPKDVMCWLA
jgi:hypothetical protein